MNDQKTDWRAYFSNLPAKDIQRAKGLVQSDKTKIDTKTFKQQIDEQNERLGKIYGGSQAPKFDLWKFLTWVFLFIGGLGLLNFLGKK